MFELLFSDSGMCHVGVDTKVPVFVVVECKRASVIMYTSWHFYFLLQGQQSIGLKLDMV